MDKQTIINRLEALDLSQYPYFEIKELIRELGNVGLFLRYIPAKQSQGHAVMET